MNSLVALCWGLTLSVLISTGSPRAIWAQSDVELLSLMSERPAAHHQESLVQLTELYVWPLEDLRPLYETSPGFAARSEEGEGATLERWTLEGLRAYLNLKVRAPDESLKRARSKRGYGRVMELARGFARRGVQSYREVELSQAQAQLESALELFEQAQHHSVDPAEVAQIHLTLGLLAVEQAQPLPALLAFREALLLNPRLRVRAEFDGAQVAERFEQARAQLIALPSDELTRLAEKARRPQRRDPQPHQLRLWLTPQGLSTSLSVWRGEHLELKRDQTRQLTARGVSALSARLWSCLPVKRSLVSSKERLLRFNVAFGAVSYLESPVSFVPFRGLDLSASVNVLRSFSALLGGAWYVSGRDAREDLRADISSYELYLGPQWRFGGVTSNTVSGALSLSASVNHSSSVTVSREVGCKFFELNERLPPQLCQPSRDITRFKPSWSIGPRVDAQLNIPIARALSVHLRGSVSSYVYRDELSPFELPFSLGIGFGYIFHLGAY